MSSTLSVVSHLHDGITSSAYKPNSTNSFQAAARGLNATFIENNGKCMPKMPVTVKPSSPDSTSFSEMAIWCADGEGKPGISVNDCRTISTVSQVYAPHTRGTSFTQQRVPIYQAWPSKVCRRLQAVDFTQTKKLPPIMLVNTICDPFTVLPWGLSMRAQLPTAFSAYRNGPGHANFDHKGQTAWAEAAFLVNGTMTTAGKIHPD